MVSGDFAALGAPDGQSDSVSEEAMPPEGSTGPEVGADGGGTTDAEGGGAGASEGGACGALVSAEGGAGQLTVSTGNLSGCTISLVGQITQVAYEPASNKAYGIDPPNQRVSAIDLATGTIEYRSLPAVPNAVCVSASRSRLFVVDTGTSLIEELDLADLSMVRRIAWPAPSYDTPDQARFQIYCGNNRLFVVDSSWAPGLWTIDNLDGCPVAVDHTSAVSGVGGMVVSADELEFYYWYQYGRVAGQAGTSVYRVSTTTWANIDQATIGYQQGFYRDPLDTPILWDHTRSLIFAKNRVFDATNLMHVLYTFTNSADAALIGAYQNAYALDETLGRMVTRHNVFSTADYSSVGAVTDSSANQYFVSTDGLLRTLLTSSSQLDCQTLP